MVERSITISFGPERTGESGDWLKLEQRPWPDTDASGFSSWLADKGLVPALDNVFSLFDRYMSVCSGEDGSFQTVVYVKKSRPDLQYSLTATNGNLGDRSIEEQVQEKSFTLEELAEELDVGARIDELYSATWEGNVYAAGGSMTSPPAVSLVNGKLAWSGKVFGVLRVKYRADVDSWPLTVTPRSDIQSDPDTKKKDLSSAYACTVVAVWNEQITSLDIEPPSMLGNCNGGVSVCIGDCSGEDDAGEDGPCLRRVIEVDACTGKKIRDYTEPMVCPEEEES